MDGPLFSNPYVLMRYGPGGEQKALIMRPLKYDDAIVLARKYFLAAKNTNIEDITLLVRVRSGDFFIADGEVWPNICKSVEEIKCEISNAVPHADEHEEVPTEDILGKRKRRGPSPAPVHAPRPSVVTRSSTRLPSSPRVSPTLPLPIPTSAPSFPSSDVLEIPGYITFHTHKILVQKWLNDYPREPWLVLPEKLHKRVAAYISRPAHLRDDVLLPVDPRQRSWIKCRAKNAKSPSRVSNQKRTFMPDDGTKVFSILCRAHNIGGHNDFRYMRNWMSTRYSFGPAVGFIRLWLEACPGCQVKRN